MELPIKNNILNVRVIPNSSKTEIREITENKVKIAVVAPPDKNKANKELINFFKKELNLIVRIKSGMTARNKVLEIKTQQ